MQGVLTTNNFEGGEQESPFSSPVRSSCHASPQRQSSPFALSPSAQSEHPLPSISNTASHSALTSHTANPHAIASPSAIPDHSVPPTLPLQSAILLKVLPVLLQPMCCPADRSHDAVAACEFSICRSGSHRPQGSLSPTFFDRTPDSQSCP